jgi:hypothetical protein
VEDLAAGDHVIPIFNGECGACAYCESDRTNLCGTYRVDASKSTMVSDGGTRFSVADRVSGRTVPVYHFLNTSTFTEYTVLDAACAAKVNPEAPLQKMCLLSCGISTGNLPVAKIEYAHGYIRFGFVGRIGHVNEQLNWNGPDWACQISCVCIWTDTAANQLVIIHSSRSDNNNVIVACVCCIVRSWGCMEHSQRFRGLHRCDFRPWRCRARGQ